MARRDWMSSRPAPITPLSARLIGYGGLVPFAGTGIVSWFLWPSETADAVLQVQLVYAALILSFLGGIRWGVAMTHAGDFKRRVPDGLGTKLALAALPALGGWLALFTMREAAFLVLMLFFAAQAISDIRMVNNDEAADWYRPLRLQLTFFVELALAASLVLTLSQ
mgnify:FL=1